MKVPEGYFKAKPGEVCRLRRSLYGLKKASRQWNKELTKYLVSQSFTQSKNEYSMFTKGTFTKDFTVILVYVDDVLLSGNNEDEIKRIKQGLDQTFTIKDLGLMKYFLSLEIARTKDGILLNQRKYILDILISLHMENCTTSNFPLPQGLHLSTDEGELLHHPEEYRRLIDRLLYLNLTRPDLTLVIQFNILVISFRILDYLIGMLLFMLCIILKAH